MNFVRKSLNSLVKLQQMFKIAEIELGMENTIGITLETGVGEGRIMPDALPKSLPYLLRTVANFFYIPSYMSGVHHLDTR